MHGGVPLPRSGEPESGAVERGLPNLEKHVENIRKFEQRCVVAINHFPTDTDEEIAVVREHCDVARPRSGGGAAVLGGRRRLPRAGRSGVGGGERSRATLPAALRLERSDRAEDPRRSRTRCTAPRRSTTSCARERDRAQLEKLGFGELPVCIAKTQQSLSDNPALLGRPKDFLVTVREIQLAAGAGFIVPITGEILRMPGLPTHPLAEQFDLSDDGEILMREAEGKAVL